MRPLEIRPEASRLERLVRRLAVPRHRLASPAALAETEAFVALALEEAGLRVERQPFGFKGREFHNVVGVLEGTDRLRPIVVVGAHFDSVAGSPGADDNASGVAALLELARWLGRGRFAATVHFVGFNLEEMQGRVPPVDRIGSRAYVAALPSRGLAVRGAFVLEMVGFTGPHQRVPASVRLVRQVPEGGRFLAAIGDGRSRRLLFAMERAANDLLPLFPLTVPLRGHLLRDTRRSDHARFWDAGWPALLITDTAFLRNPHYHRSTDTPDTLDYSFLCKVIEVVAEAVSETACGPPSLGP